MNGRRIRAHNRSALLRLLRAQGPLPRAVLASRAGLSATTVTNVVNQLLAEGYIAEVPASPQGKGRVGRPAIDIALVPAARVVCGVQVGVGTVRLAVCDLRAEVVEDELIDFDINQTPEQVIALIAGAVPPLVARAGFSFDQVIGVGVGAPGPVDPAQRVNLMSINLGWRDVRFSDQLEKALGVPTVVDHNVRAMAMAEARYGHGRGCESLAFIYVRTGVGAGLVFNGQAYRGGTHGATELGHLHIGAGDRPCSCGSTGCLETVAADGYLVERARAAAGTEPDARLAVEMGAGHEPLSALIHAAQAGDPAATGILDEVAGNLATGLANLVNLLNPQLIVVGGFFSDAGEVALASLRRQFRPQLFSLLREAVHIEPTSFGAHVGVVGAATVALDRFFYDTEATRESEPATPPSRQAAG